MAYFAGVNTDILHHTDLIYSTQPVRTQTCGLQNVQVFHFAADVGAEKMGRKSCVAVFGDIQQGKCMVKLRGLSPKKSASTLGW